MELFIITEELSCPIYNMGEEFKIEIPRMFYSDADDKPFENCQVCGKYLLEKGNSYVIEKAFKKLEIETVDATRIIATTIENLIVRPTTYHALVESFENFSVEEIKITNKDIDSLQVKEIPFHKDAILMMVKRGNNSYIPHGETFFRLGDIIHVFGTDSALEDTRLKLS